MKLFKLESNPYLLFTAKSAGVVLTLGLALAGLHQAVFRYAVAPDMAFAAESADSGIHMMHASGLVMSSENDPSFDANGLFRADIRADRCRQAMTVLAAYDASWSRAAQYEGRPVRDHALAVTVATVAHVLAYRQSCEDRQSVLADVAQYQKTVKSDVAITRAADLLRHVPITTLQDHRGLVSLAYLETAMSSEAFGHIQTQLCEADKVRAGVAAKDAFAVCHAS